MSMKAYQFVGLAKPVYLPDDIIVEIAIVPATVRNVRSNQKRSLAQVTTFTQHETANFNAGANADMHKRWLHGGASGSSVGFNFAVDDKKIIQLTPLDEVTWAAGTPKGNLSSDHSELCVNSDINHTKARRNAAALAAGVLKARGLSVNAGLVQHNMWTRKNCPALMRANNNAIWNKTFVPMVKEFYDGTTPAPTPSPSPSPSYPSAIRIPEADEGTDPLILDNGSVLIHSPLTVKTTRPTPRLLYAGGDDRVGPDIPAGSDFVVQRLIINKDGSMYWYTPYATRVRYEDTRIIGSV